MSKIALVIGHNARSQGAVRVTDKRTEYDINSDLAVAIRDLDPGPAMSSCGAQLAGPRLPAPMQGLTGWASRPRSSCISTRRRRPVPPAPKL